MRASVLLLSIVLLLGLSCHAPEPQSNSMPSTIETSPEKTLPAEIVRVAASEVTVTPGGQAPAAVDLTIAENFHINANPPSATYLIPTELKVAPAEGLSADNFVYPAAINQKFSFSAQPIAVYEKSAQIKFVVRAGQEVKKGAHTLRATLRVQPCDQTACYASRMIETSLPITVR